MKCDIQFFRCDRCGNLVRVLNDGGGQLVCCEQNMRKLVPNTVEASGEKHVPVFAFSGDELLVKVGSAAHPMTEEHFIEWIAVRAGDEEQIRFLHPGDKPEAVFRAKEDVPLSIFAYCNLHGLWRADYEGYLFGETVCSAEFPEGCIDPVD